MAIKGVLFDKDGTLLDFHATWIPAYRSAAAVVCREAGRPDLADRLLSVAGYDHVADKCDPTSPLGCGTTAEIATLWASEAGLADARAVEAKLEQVFDCDGARRAIAIPGLRPLLERLSRRGLALGVATMDSEALARFTVSRFGIDSYMSFVCGYDSGFGVKPEPGMMQAFCRHVDLNAGEVAMVGDTPHDLLMGRAAGAGLVVGVLSGASTREILEPHCDGVVENVLALEAVLDQ